MKRTIAFAVLIGLGMATSAYAAQAENTDVLSFYNEYQEKRADNKADRGSGN